MNKDLKEKFAFTLAEGATHVGIFHNIGGTFHRFVESFTHVRTSHNTRRVAFTLAEVLITLGIIGIVSAMTIPTLISNYQEKVTVTKLKKMFSTLSNAYQLYRVDNPAPQTFPITEEGAIQAFEVFKPYLKIAKDCGTDDAFGCTYEGVYYFKNGTSTGQAYSQESKYYKILLADGASVFFRGGPTTAELMHIYYDVNGPQKPNTFGHDTFIFVAYKDKLQPYGSFDEHCSPANAFGVTCAGWVIYKGNLDYLKCPDKLTWEDSKCPE